MSRIILITFGVLGWTWYEMSGGSDFEPGQNGLKVLAKVEQQELPQPQVTRAANGADLTAVSQPKVAQPDVPAQVEQVSLTSTKVDPVQSKPVRQQVTLAVDALTAPDKANTVLAAAVDYRAVSGSRVNLRQGPSTDFSVVTQLRRGDEVEVLQDDGSGWVKLRALEGNNVGWMSEDFLAALN